MPMSEKLDLHKEHKTEYLASKKAPALVEVGPASYLTIEGQGAPGGEKFANNVGILYGAAFTIKMTSKFAGRDYKLCHLKGLWWGDDDGFDFFDHPRDRRRWKLLIRVPDFIASGDLDAAVAVLLSKGKGPEVLHVTLESLDEGLCVQMLHVGPYDAEKRTIDEMRRFMDQNCLSQRDAHHEVYLSDPRRVPPERLRTILRLPVTG